MDGVNRGKYSTKQYAVNIAGNTHPETLFDWRESKLPIRKSFGRQKIFLWKRSSEIITMLSRRGRPQSRKKIRR